MTGWSLRSRLFVLIVAPLIVVAALAGAARFVLAERMSQKLYDDTLLAVALTISRDVILSEGDLLAEELLERLTAALGAPVYYRILGPGGRFVTGYSDAPERPPETVVERGRPAFFDATVLGRRVRAVTLEEFISEPQFGGWVTVEVWQTVEQRERLSLMLVYQSMAIMGVVIFSAGLLVWFGIKIGLRPLDALRDAVELRSADELRPIARAVPREVESLVAAINALFERLRRSFVARDAFIADAAHQLRNPVAAIQTQAESMLTAPDEVELRRRAVDLVATARRVSRLTGQLLTLELTRDGVAPLRNTPVDLMEIVRGVARRAAETHARDGVDISFATSGPERLVLGDNILIEEAVENLVDNAVRYGARGGGTVSIGLGFEEIEAVVSISDDGPGVPPELRGRVFDRFFRADQSSGDGSGLGLAIVQGIADNCGGSVRFVDRSRGTCVEFRLRIAA